MLFYWCCWSVLPTLRLKRWRTQEPPQSCPAASPWIKMRPHALVRFRSRKDARWPRYREPHIRGRPSRRAAGFSAGSMKRKPTGRPRSSVRATNASPCIARSSSAFDSCALHSNPSTGPPCLSQRSSNKKRGPWDSMRSGSHRSPTSTDQPVLPTNNLLLPSHHSSNASSIV